MKKKIKTWLIHLLGGVTVAENKKGNYISFFFGKKCECIDIRDYADSLYGTPADEWCKLMYKQICRQLDSVTHGTDEEIPTGK